jgi:ribosomal protein L20A (L18A)
MDLYKIKKRFIRDFVRCCYEKCIEENMNCWAEVALEEFAGRHRLGRCTISNAKWSEIDNLEDLEEAKRIWS